MRCALLVVAAACSSSARAPTHADRALPPHRDAGTPVIAAAGPTDAECTALIAHAIALGAAEDREPASAEDQAAIRARLEADYLPRCKAGARDEVRCGLAAATSAALVACQRTPSSSTSNSSVAPPGITPPAPRSP